MGLAAHPARRRLLRLRAALATAPAAAAVAEPPAAVGTAPASLLPLPLDVKERGIEPAALGRITARKDQAIADEDYRVAAEMHDLLTVLQPKPPLEALTVADASPPTLAGQIRFFETYGFVVLPKVFAGAALERLVAAWREVQRPVGPVWREQLRVQEEVAAEFDKTQLPDESAADFYRRRSEAGADRAIGRNYYDIATPDLYAALKVQLESGSTDPGGAALMDLLDPPRLVELLRALLGHDLHMFGIQARTYPHSSPVSAVGTGTGADPEELRGYIGK